MVVASHRKARLQQTLGNAVIAPDVLAQAVHQQDGGARLYTYRRRPIQQRQRVAVAWQFRADTSLHASSALKAFAQ